MSHPTLLSRLAGERHWTAEDGAREYERTAREMGLPSTISTRQWSRWVSGELRQLPRPVCCRVLERMFGRPVRDLLASPDEEPRAGAAASSEVSADLLAAAAEESAAHVAEMESTTIGPATLEQAFDDAVSLARSYGTTAPWRVFHDAARARRRVCDLLGRTARPDQQRDLYLILGQLCGMLAVASFDLGDETSATQHARAAWGYGEHIGHDGLRTWARGTQALIAYWGGRPADAVRLAQSGRRYATSGTGLVRVCCIEARAWSYLGNRHAAEQVLTAAQQARHAASDADELHDQVGGEYGFSPARQARCEGTVYVQLGDATAAIGRTQQALQLFRDSGQASVKVIPQAHADLAAAHVLRGSAGEAAEVLAPVLILPPEHRIRGLVERLVTVHALLGAERFKSVRAAQHLRGELTDFMAVSASPAINSAAHRLALPPARR